MDTKTILSEASDRMQKTIEHLEEELLNIRAGKASPTVLNGVFVDYYGSQTPISGVASVTVPDAKTILIQPWDKNLIRAIEKAIIDSNIGLTPSNNGEQIRLSIPPLTEERRKELVKQIKSEAETARISRYARRRKPPASACATHAGTLSKPSRRPRRKACPKTRRKTVKPRRRSCSTSSPNRWTRYSTTRKKRS